MSQEIKPNDQSPQKPAGRTLLGKEAKIGVAVIAVLLIVLGAVAVKRLAGPGTDDGPSAANEVEVASGPPAPTNAKSDPFQFRRKLEIPAPPTVVAEASPTKTAPAEPPKTASDDSAPWKLTSARREKKFDGGDRQMHGSAPSLMPEPPKPFNLERKNRYALETPSSADVADAKPLGGPDAGAQPATPPSEPAALDRKNADGKDASGFATIEAPTPSPPRADPSFSDVGDRYAPVAPAARQEPSDDRGRFSEPRFEAPAPRPSRAYSHRRSPPPRDDGKAEVQPNDSYWTLSERLYGTGAYFKALDQFNRHAGASDEALKPGELILAPPLAELEKSYPELCPKAERREAMQTQSQNRASTVSTRNSFRGGRSYTVTEGDTLFNIARYELGKASRWAEIYDLNRDMLGKDFHYLTPGTRLILPESERSDALAQPPASGWRR